MGQDGVALAAIVIEGLILCWLSWGVASTRGRGALLWGIVVAGAIWGVSVGFARVRAPIPDDDLAASVIRWALYGAGTGVLLSLTWMTFGRYGLHRRRKADERAPAERAARPAPVPVPVPLPLPSTSSANGHRHRRRRRVARRAARAGAG